MNARKHLLYLALEAPREGQASYAHIHEIVGGLQRRSWTVDLFVPSYSGHWKRPGLARRMMEYLCLQWRVMRAFEEGQSVYVRSHFLAFPPMPGRGRSPASSNGCGASSSNGPTA